MTYKKCPSTRKKIQDDIQKNALAQENNNSMIYKKMSWHKKTITVWHTKKCPSTRKQLQYGIQKKSQHKKTITVWHTKNVLAQENNYSMTYKNVLAQENNYSMTYKNVLAQENNYSMTYKKCPCTRKQLQYNIHVHFDVPEYFFQLEKPYNVLVLYDAKYCYPN